MFFLSTEDIDMLQNYCRTNFTQPFQFDYYATVASTNLTLLKQAKLGAIEHRVIIAQTQTSGRGRQGKVWQSQLPQQTALTLSLGIPINQLDLTGFSLALGVAIAQALDEKILVKWPNDLYLYGKKLGGILVEVANLNTKSNDQYLVIGVGLNLALPSVRPNLKAVGLDALENKFSQLQVAIKVISAVVSAYEKFSKFGFSVFQQDFTVKDFLLNKLVKLSSGLTGTAIGVTKKGALLVENKTVIHSIVSNEVSIMWQD